MEIFHAESQKSNEKKPWSKSGKKVDPWFRFGKEPAVPSAAPSCASISAARC